MGSFCRNAVARQCLVFALLVPAGTMHCHASTSPSPVAPSAGLVASLKPFIAARCQRSVECGWSPDRATCEAVANAGLAGLRDSRFHDSTWALARGIATGKVAFDPAALSACDEEILRSPVCESPYLDQKLWFFAPVCRQAFRGNVAEGGSCYSMAECQDGLTCVTKGASAWDCGGVCARAGVVCQNASDCFSGTVCGDGGRCAPETPPAGGAGEPCGLYGQCLPGLACNVGGRCVAAVDGGACTATACDGPAGLVCRGSDGGPSVWRPLGAAGEPCSGECSLRSTCALNLMCTPSDDMTTYTCLAPKSVGEACTHLFECGVLAYCDAKTHTCAPKPESGPCPGTGQARARTCSPLTSFCDTETHPGTATCAPLAGAACKAKTDCRFGYDCVNGTCAATECAE